MYAQPKLNTPRLRQILEFPQQTLDVVFGDVLGCTVEPRLLHILTT